LLVLDIQGLCQTERNSQNKTILAKSSKHLLESWLKPSEMMQEQFSGDRHHIDDNDHMRKGKREKWDPKLWIYSCNDLEEDYTGDILLSSSISHNTSHINLKKYTSHIA
jgi:hypothetical protein